MGPAGAGTRECLHKGDRLGGVEVIWALPVGADNSRAIVYTHGGGFAVGSADSHRKLAGHLAKALHVTAVVLHYEELGRIAAWYESL
jgi:epsilon-lactone hydrolase